MNQSSKSYSKIIPSPIGLLFLVAQNNRLISLDTEANLFFSNSIESTNNSFLIRVQTQLNQYFSGNRQTFNLELGPIGTPFQLKVWSALLQIPYGEVWSYGQQAKFIQSPKAFRAVGGANGKNPIPIIIPCHRVIGANGKLTGFSNGLPMKLKLLELEGHSFDHSLILRK